MKGPKIRLKGKKKWEGETHRELLSLASWNNSRLAHLPLLSQGKDSTDTSFGYCKFPLNYF